METKLAELESLRKALELDIAEGRAVRGPLEHCEGRFRLIFEYHPDCIKVVSSAGDLEAMNPAGLAMIEADSFEQVRGMSLLELLMPDYRQAYLEMHLDVIAGHAGRLKYEMIGLRGKRRWMETVAVPLRNADGTISDLAITRDITRRKESKELLRRSQDHLATLIHSVDGIVWEADARTFQFTYVSPRAERLLGYPLADWTSNPTFWIDHVHPEDRADAVRYCLECTRDKRDHTFEYRMLAADGREIWLRDIVTVVLEDGCAVKLRGLMVDITERRQADQALAESERRFREVYESSLDAIFIEDANGQVRDVNPAACKLHGLSRDQLIGKNVRDLVPPEHRDLIDRDYPKLLSGELTQTEGLSLHADGTVVPVELSVSRMNFGGQPALLLHVRDITERKRVQDALRASEERYRLLFEKNLAGVFQSTPDGTIIDCNEAFVRMFGYASKAQLLACRAEDFYPPGERTSFLKDLYSNRSLTGYELQLKRKDGSIIWGYENVALLPPGPQGESIIQGTIVDFTELKEAEHALRDSEARLENAQARAKVGDWERDLRTMKGTWSKQMYRMFNLDPDTEPPNFNEFLRLLHPGDRHKLIDCVAQAATMTGPSFIEYRTNPSLGPVRWYSSTLVAVRDQSGDVTHLAGTLIDITELKLAEEAIRTSEERFRAVVEQAPDGIFVRERDDRIVDVSPAACAMSGYSREELLTRNGLDLYPEHEHPRVAAAIARVRRGEAVLEERQFRRKDGTIFPCEVSAQLMRDGRILKFVRDISERKRAEEEREELNREVEASHQRLEALSRRLLEVQETERRYLARELHDEIGQVLSAISVNLKIASTKVGPEALPRMNESIAMVDRAVEQVRNLSLDLRPAVLDDFGLEAALRWYAQSQAERGGYTVSVKATPAVVEPPADLRNACFRIAQEALTNVVRHAAANQVWIVLEQNEHEMRFTIRDDGLGFDATSAQMRASRGGSLGLLSMRERAELLGGRVEIRSEPGRGTIVDVRIPVQFQDEAVV